MGLRQIIPWTALCFNSFTLTQTINTLAADIQKMKDRIDAVERDALNLGYLTGVDRNGRRIGPRMPSATQLIDTVTSGSYSFARSFGRTFDQFRLLCSARSSRLPLVPPRRSWRVREGSQRPWFAVPCCIPCQHQIQSKLAGIETKA